MIFGFFAVAAPGYIVAMVCQCDRCARRQWDAFIGRTKQDIEINLGVQDGFGVKFTELLQGLTVGKQSGIKKIRADPTGFGGKFTKAQDLLFNGELKKLVAKIVHVVTV